MDNRIFNIHTDVKARNYTWECTDTLRESAPKVDSGDKSRAASGNCSCHSPQSQVYDFTLTFPQRTASILTEDVTTVGDVT